MVNDGRSLLEVGNQSIDFAFSFDPLVHSDQSVLETYRSELARVLDAQRCRLPPPSNSRRAPAGLPDLGRSRSPQSRAAQSTTTPARYSDDDRPTGRLVDIQSGDREGVRRLADADEERSGAHGEGARP